MQTWRVFAEPVTYYNYTHILMQLDLLDSLYKLYIYMIIHMHKNLHYACQMSSLSTAHGLYMTYQKHENIILL